MSRWSAIVGAPGTDKGRAALRLAERLRGHGLRVAGFVQEDVPDAEGETVGWDVVSVTDPSRRGVLARTSERAHICGYEFLESGFSLARALASEPADVVIVGGVGKLEAARQGHWPLLESLIAASSGPHVVACIRDTCLSTVALALPDPDGYVELPCEDAEIERLADGVASAVTSR